MHLQILKSTFPEIQPLREPFLHKLNAQIWVHSARCNVTNTASKATLLKAGFKVCGAILNGKIKGRY